MLWRATQGVVDGRMTLGDLVLVNAFMIQLYIPLNFLGVMYREIKQSLTDLDKHVRAARRRTARSPTGPARPPLAAGARRRCASNTSTSATSPRAQILHDVELRRSRPARRVAVVGPSGSGKSTLARLLFRFYDVEPGRITIDGQDSATVTQASVRAGDRHRAAGHGAVQRHHRIQHRLRPARAPAREDVIEAARAAHIHDFIESLPEGYQTHGGRARAEAVGRREAARGDRAHAAEEPGRS